MSDLIPMPPEYDDMRERLKDIFEPALHQQEKFKHLFVDAFSSLPQIKGSLDQYPNTKSIVSSGSIPHTYFSQLEKQIQDSLFDWNSSLREITENARKLQENIEFAEQTLLSEESPLYVWGNYGWTISPRAMIKHFYYVPKSKDDADQYMDSIHDEKAIDITFQMLKKSAFHSLSDIDEIEDLYRNGKYKPCALMLFSLIDSLLIHTQDEDKLSTRRKTGYKAISFYRDKAQPEDCSELAVKVLCFITSTKALQVFFADGDDFQNINPVLNRNLACHGMLQRAVNKTDCIQLSLLYENMLYCIGLI